MLRESGSWMKTIIHLSFPRRKSTSASWKKTLSNLRSLFNSWCQNFRRSDPKSRPSLPLGKKTWKPLQKLSKTRQTSNRSVKKHSSKKRRLMTKLATFLSSWKKLKLMKSKVKLPNKTSTTTLHKWCNNPLSSKTKEKGYRSKLIKDTKGWCK